MLLNRLKAVCAASSLALALAVSPGAANAATELVVNGGFTGSVKVGSTAVSAVSATQIAGWTVLTNYVDWFNGAWQSSDGDGYSLDLMGGYGLGAIGQTIATEAGRTYNLTFDISGNPDAQRAAGRFITVSAGGAAVGATQYVMGPTNTRANMLWSSRSMSFVATGALTQIVFTGTSDTPANCCWGAALDNVSVMAAVPEPATWAMMIIGFGAVGSMVRSSRRRNAFSAA